MAFNKNFEERKRIGGRLREIRREKKLPQSEVAEKIGIIQSTYARIESGAFATGIDTYLNIANAMGHEIVFVKKPEPVVPAESSPSEG